MNLPDDVMIVPSLVIYFVAIREIIRRRKEGEPVKDSGATLYIMIVIFIVALMGSLSQFIFPNLKDTIKNTISWISLICAIILLPYYLWLHPFKFRNSRQND